MNLIGAEEKCVRNFSRKISRDERTTSRTLACMEW